MEASGFNILHDLPSNPPDDHDCPYSSVSAFALDTQRLDLEQLVARGDLSRSSLERYQNNVSSGDYDLKRARSAKNKLITEAASNFISDAEDADLQSFTDWVSHEKDWLEPYVAFEILKGIPGNEGKSWQNWETGKDFSASLVNDIRHKYTDEFNALSYGQWMAEQQAIRYRELAKQFGVEIWGDVPFYVGAGEVWSNREIFNLDANGNQLSKGGCPPDDFSESGQVWGNATYKVNLDDHETTGKVIDWWEKRLDRVGKINGGPTRLDHVIGLAAPWIIPNERDDGRVGRRDPGIGRQLLGRLAQKGILNLYAEDLGEKNADAEAMMRDYKLFCTRVGVFALGNLNSGGIGSFNESEHNPSNYSERTVGFTSNHDTPTLVQQIEGLHPEARYQFVEYIRSQFPNSGVGDHLSNEQLALFEINRTLGSRAMVAITTPWDVLGLGQEGRYNIPGTVGPQNWSWSMSRSQIDAMGRRLAQIRSL